MQLHRAARDDAEGREPVHPVVELRRDEHDPPGLAELEVPEARDERTGSLNIELQRTLNGRAEPRVERVGWTFAPGDRVMQIENDYDKDVYNGDIGRVATVDLDAREMAVDFEGRRVVYDFGELDRVVLAYATTIHKAQGSEYPAVVVPLTTQHYPMLRRNLVYTAVTRGKRLVVLVGQTRALALAVKGQQVRRRWSKLRDFLSAPA